MQAPLEALSEYMQLIVCDTKVLMNLSKDFPFGGQDVVNHKINSLANNMIALQRLRPQVRDIVVPLDVFDYIDADITPEAFTNDMARLAAVKYARVKTAKDRFAKLKTVLLLELWRAFPLQISQYCSYRPAAVLHAYQQQKQQQQQQQQRQHEKIVNGPTSKQAKQRPTIVRLKRPPPIRLVFRRGEAPKTLKKPTHAACRPSAP